MSATSTAVSEALIRYIAGHAAPEPRILTELREAAVAAGIPAIQISPEQAAYMSVLLKLTGAREVVEVGTLAGYSAITMARALPEGGRVRTIELEAAHADFTEEWVRRAELEGKIEVHRGAGCDVLPGFATDSADACFIDADKVNYHRYLDECCRIVRSGGLIMVDNAFAFGNLLDPTCTDESVEAIRAFNERMVADDRVEGFLTPIGDGCWIAVNR